MSRAAGFTMVVDCNVRLAFNSSEPFDLAQGERTRQIPFVVRFLNMNNKRWLLQFTSVARSQAARRRFEIARSM